MIRYSHVSLSISCDSGSATAITAALGVEPSRVREGKSLVRAPEGSVRGRVQDTWMLDSPKNDVEGDPTIRLQALADAIEPFGCKLPSIRAEYQSVIDVLYHLTPQHPHGVTGEFDWLRLPADLMRRYVASRIPTGFHPPAQG